MEATLTGARLQDGGRRFVLVLVTPDVMEPGKRDDIRIGLRVRMGGAEVVLVTQRTDGVLEFFGDSRLVAHLMRLEPRSIPWTNLRLGRGG